MVLFISSERAVPLKGEALFGFIYSHVGGRATDNFFTLPERLRLSLLVAFFGFVINLAFAFPLLFVTQSLWLSTNFVVAGILSAPSAFLISTTREGVIARSFSFTVFNYLIGLVLAVAVVAPLLK